MGQYYRAVLIAEDGTRRIMTPDVYNDGYKLMEHSWIGDDFVNAVLAEIDNNPHHLAWMGDYANTAPDNGKNFNDGFVKNTEELLDIYDGVWTGNGKIPCVSPESNHPYLLTGKDADCFIVNLTKKCFIDMQAYVDINTSDGSWCVNPLPILTSIGNGQGGGDYHGLGEDFAGTWAFDKIYVTALKPRHLEEVMFCFHE